MTRLEENKIMINAVNGIDIVKLNPIGSYEGMASLQLSIIATTLIDISKSLAAIADKAESEDKE